jgi:hypothetical protein
MEVSSVNFVTKVFFAAVCKQYSTGTEACSRDVHDEERKGSHAAFVLSTNKPA